MNDSEILEALFRWQEEHFYSSLQLCHELNINKNTLLNWKQGKPLSPRTRQKIVNLISSKSDKDEISNIKSRILSFPIISDAAAATVNTSYFPVGEYARTYAEDYVSFTKGCEGDFVIRVIGDSMSPWYPPGTLLLVRPNAVLRNGDRVIAILTDGTILFKLFAEDDSSFYLLSENRQNGKDYKFAKNDFNGVRAMYLVIQSMRDERALDDAKEKQGIVSDWKERIKNLQ